MELKETLKDIGLTEEESKIYLELLKLGESLASKIAKETKINRSHVYQILERLISKGFVSYVIKENRKYFIAIEPSKILEIIREKEHKIKSILPSLLQLTNTSKNKPRVEILEGTPGIKTILNDILKMKKEWFGFGSSGKGPETLPYYSEHWEKQRIKNKIKLKGILDNSKDGRQRGKELSKLSYTQIKYMQKEYSSPTSTWIYGDRIVFIIWNKDSSFAIRIIDSDLAENYKQHFEDLWKIATS